MGVSLTVNAATLAVLIKVGGAYVTSQRKDERWRAGVDTGMVDLAKNVGEIKSAQSQLAVEIHGPNGFLHKSDLMEILAKEAEILGLKYGADIARHDGEVSRVRHRVNNIYASLAKVAAKVGVDIHIPTEDDG